VAKVVTHAATTATDEVAVTVDRVGAQVDGVGAHSDRVTGVVDEVVEDARASADHAAQTVRGDAQETVQHAGGDPAKKIMPPEKATPPEPAPLPAAAFGVSGSEPDFEQPVDSRFAGGFVWPAVALNSWLSTLEGASSIKAGAAGSPPSFVAPGSSASAAAGAVSATPERPARPDVPQPLPAPAPATAATSGAGGSTIFIPVAALMALLALSAPAILRGLKEAGAMRPSAPFLCALERPG
jgi:hypothetical protein